MKFSRSSADLVMDTLLLVLLSVPDQLEVTFPWIQVYRQYSVELGITIKAGLAMAISVF